MAKLKKPVLYGLYGVSAIAILGGLYAVRGFLPDIAGVEARIPEKIQIPKADVIAGAPAQDYELTANPASNFQGCVTLRTIPWQGGGSFHLANGDARTTNDSLMKKFSGGCVSTVRDDDYMNMQNDMTKFAQNWANGQAFPENGTAFSIIMGSGAPAFLQALNEQLKDIKGPDGKPQSAVVFGIAGFSYGEDKFMGPPINGDPQKVRGWVVSAYPMDGDQHVYINYAADNGICVNTDQATYDANCINAFDAKDLKDAVNKYLTGASDERDVVKDGVKTGEKIVVTVNSVATWTPYDYTVFTEAQKRGKTLVTIADTRDYDQMMPTVIIGNKGWLEANRQFTVGMLKAIDRGAFEIRAGDGLTRMSLIHANLFGTTPEEQDPSYWAKAFVGYDLKDKQGNVVNIGGSRVSTLAEVRAFLGIEQGSFNTYKAVYETFGDHDVKNYPNILTKYPKYEDAVDTSFVEDALRGVVMGAPTKSQFAEQKVMGEAISTRPVTIEFDLGTANIRPESREAIQRIASQAALNSLLIRIDGHTDASGSDSVNIPLSKARADAVAAELRRLAPNTFPANRIATRGYGSTKPVGSDAQNRRVEIVFGR